MEFVETKLKGCYVIKLLKFEDDRGTFVKTFHQGNFKAKVGEINFRESFFSISNRNVIRGMHFQIPPHDHAKLIFCTFGEIIDVVVDIRKDSPTFKEHVSIKLSPGEANAIFIPSGFAHGFSTISEKSTVMYNTTKEYSQEYDKGIRWDSINFNWKINMPIISERDKKLPKLDEYKTPF
jgi:dTDP-4-dehydrorhamnose 3,5-epimerase